MEETIPEDVLHKATMIASQYFAPQRLDRGRLARDIARAILAERERCAVISEMHDHRGDIATSIRSGV